MPDARIVSVGPPTPYQPSAQLIAERLGVAERVELRGYVARRELLELYATRGVVAVPSRYEGFGYAAAQALCAGMPCVVSDRSALPEIVAGDAGVVPVGRRRRAGSTRCAPALCGGDDDARARPARERAIDAVRVARERARDAKASTKRRSALSKSAIPGRPARRCRRRERR